MPVKVYVGLVAPDMLLHEPVPLGDDCHWKVKPVANVYPDADNVKEVLPPPNAGDTADVPAVGVPEQGARPKPVTATFTVQVSPPPLIPILPL